VVVVVFRGTREAGDDALVSLGLGERLQPIAETAGVGRATQLALETILLRKLVCRRNPDPEGVEFDSPGCSAAEPWVNGRRTIVSPNGAPFRGGERPVSRHIIGARAALLARHLIHRSAQGGWGLEVAAIILAAFFRRLPSNLGGCHALQLAIFDITRQSGRRRRAAVSVQRCTGTPQRALSGVSPNADQARLRIFGIGLCIFEDCPKFSKAAKQFGRLPRFAVGHLQCRPTAGSPPVGGRFGATCTKTHHRWVCLEFRRTLTELRPRIFGIEGCQPIWKAATVLQFGHFPIAEHGHYPATASRPFAPFRPRATQLLNTNTGVRASGSRPMPREQPDVGTSAALDLRLHETLAYWAFPPGSDTPAPRGALGINQW